jgi:23S rRNA (pseudouridine1915-N3)-methyltransferase
MIARVIAVGRIASKDPSAQALVDEYVKRCRSPWTIELLETRDLAVLRSKAGRPRVVLDERGDDIDSVKLARWLERWRDDGVRRVDFLIGGADGFAHEDRKAADRVLRLSSMTLPHRLARVVLVEQLYRAATISTGHPYHRA